MLEKQTIKPLDTAYVAWMKSDHFKAHFTHNFDPADAESGGASVLVGVGFVASISLFFVPGSGSSNSAMAVMLFGLSMSMLGMIIKARKQP